MSEKSCENCILQKVRKWDVTKWNVCQSGWSSPILCEKNITDIDSPKKRWITSYPPICWGKSYWKMNTKLHIYNSIPYKLQAKIFGIMYFSTGLRIKNSPPSPPRYKAPSRTRTFWHAVIIGGSSRASFQTFFCAVSVPVFFCLLRRLLFFVSKNGRKSRCELPNGVCVLRFKLKSGVLRRFKCNNTFPLHTSSYFKSLKSLKICIYIIDLEILQFWDIHKQCRNLTQRSVQFTKKKIQPMGTLWRSIRCSWGAWAALSHSNFHFSICSAVNSVTVLTPASFSSSSSPEMRNADAHSRAMSSADGDSDEK